MNTNFIKVDSSKVSGTSFHNGIVKATANEISEVLGNYVGGDEDKVYRNWKLKVNNTILQYMIGKRESPQKMKYLNIILVLLLQKILKKL